MLAFAFLIVAALLFLLAASNAAAVQPYAGRLQPLGLFFGTLAMIVPLWP